MDDLTAFIAARLDEDEAIALSARDAKRLHWQDDEWSDQPDEWISHCARHDSARVLREVAAKRAMVALHAIHSEPERWGDSHPDPAMRGQPTGHASYWCATCDHDRDYGHIGGREEGCPTLRAMAAVWSDNAGYQPEWRPEG